MRESPNNTFRLSFTWSIWDVHVSRLRSILVLVVDVLSFIQSVIFES